MDPLVIILIATFLAVAAVALFVIYLVDTIKDYRSAPKPTPDYQNGSQSDLRVQGIQPAFEEESSPLWPQHLVDLFIRPRHFFTGQLALGKTPYVVFVTWCFGVATTIQRIDGDATRDSAGRSSPLWESLGLAVATSWADFWLWALSMGAVAGFFIWWLGGWWYGVRLRWSGAQNFNDRLSHQLYVYSSFVESGPAILLVLFWTISKPGYAQALQSSGLFVLPLLIFPLWALAVSYLGARTLFAVNVWKARIWFLILPATIYILVLGILASLSLLFKS